MRVSSRKKWVCMSIDELLGQILRALTGLLRDRRLGARYAENRSIGVVHRYECCRHACGGLKKGAAAHALMVRQLAPVAFDPCFELALLCGLRCRHEFVARHLLRRNWRSLSVRISVQHM